MDSASVLRGFTAAVILSASSTAVHAATFATAWNLQWTGAVGVNGVWAVTASSGFNDGIGGDPPDESPPYDQVDVNVAISGEVIIRNTGSATFTGDDVIGLTLSVFSSGVRISSFEFAKEDLKFGVMSGTFSGVPGDGATISLSHLALVQDTDKFRQQFGCVLIFSEECTSSYLTPLPAFPSGNPVPPGPPGTLYGSLIVQDGRADPCCGARVNQLRFFYQTEADALASISLTYDGRRVFPDDDISGLPPPIVPVPASLPLLLGGMGALGWAKLRRKKAPV